MNLSFVLGVMFIALKLTGFIHWSWWWVVSPFFVWFGLVFVRELINELKRPERRKYRR